MPLKKIAIFALPTVIALVVLGGWFMLAGGGRRAASDSKPAGAAAYVPSAKLKDAMANPKTRLQTAVKAGEQKQKAAIVLLKYYADKDKDPDVRAACVRAMGQIGDPDCTQAVIKAAQDSDPAVRLAAIAAMADLKEPSGACANELVRLTRGDDPEIRRAAARALASYRDADASTALTRLLGDEDSETRVAAAAELARRRDDAARAGVARAVDNQSTAAREEAARGLARDPLPSQWPALCRALLDPAESVRAIAAPAVRKTGPPIADSIARAIHAGITVPARRQAASLLIEMNAPQTVPALVRCLDKLSSKSKDADALRGEIVAHLKKLGPAALGPLTTGGIDARIDLYPKEAVAEVCVFLGPAAAKPIQDRILKWTLFPNGLELCLWVKTLGTIGDAEAIAALNRALAQDVHGMEGLVAEARKNIEGRTGKPLPPAQPDPGDVAGTQGYEVNRVLTRMLTPPAREPGKLPPDAAVVLRLTGSLTLPKDHTQRRNLMIELTRRDGRWAEVAMVSSRGYNQAFHDAEILESDDQRMRLEVVVNDDPWVSGGFGCYQLEFAPDAEGAEIKGRFTGTYNYRPVSGEVVGELRPLPPAEADDVPPLQSGEHPRLVFRKGEIPAMRKRALTPIGKAIVAAIRDRVEGRGTSVAEHTGADGAIGAGFLYALYGDEAMGRRAVPMLLAAAGKPPQGGSHAAHAMCYEMNSAAFAYDFVYDTLSDDQRAKITNYLAATQGIVLPSVGLTGNFNNGPASNWTAIGTGAAGLAALATLKEKGPLGVNPGREVMPVYELAGDSELKPAEGVPVNEYGGGEGIRKWLLLGPFDGPEGDPLAELGGPEKAQLQPGVTLEHNGESRKCVPLAEDALKPQTAFADKPFTIRIPVAVPGSRSYLYGVLSVAEERGTLVDLTYPLGFQDATLWLNGQRIASGSHAILKPGLHRMLLEVRGAIVCPMLYDADARFRMGQYLRYQRRLRRFEAAKQHHDRTGERQDVVVRLRHARNSMVNWWRNSIGEHGWGTESGYYHAHGELMPFAIAYDTAMGEQLVATTGIPWLAPLSTALYTASGRPYFSNVKGSPLGMVLHVTDPQVRPALLMAFEGERRSKTLSQMGCKELAFLFANFPLDEEARPATEVIPLAFADRRKGGYVFRSSYDKGGPPRAAKSGGYLVGGGYVTPSSLDKGLDDIVAGVFLRSEVSGGGYNFCEAGTFNISGMGTNWGVTMPGNKRGWQYAQQNVVVCPPGNGAGHGKQIYYEAGPDGSGVLGADMTHVYRDEETVRKATRHFAADYSGKCGAPALFVVVDRIEGGAEKTWLMHSGAVATTVDGRRFTMQGQLPDTALCGQVISENDVTLAVGPIFWRHKNPEYVKAQKALAAGKSGVKPGPAPPGSIKPKVMIGDVEVAGAEIPEYIAEPYGTPATFRASTKDPSLDCMVVMTIQKGPPPQIAVEGKGLGATVKVGGSTVRFVNDRLVIE